jgi:flagella basal body P-ring formation protein FlgA
MRNLLMTLALLLPAPVTAGVLAAAHTLPAGTIISASDLRAIDSNRPGLDDPSQIVGQQARITIYEGRPFQKSMLKTPVLVSRNDTVTLIFRHGPLEVTTQGRALSEGAAGDVVRVMNIDSRATVTARVMPDGTLLTSN